MGTFDEENVSVDWLVIFLQQKEVDRLVELNGPTTKVQNTGPAHYLQNKGVTHLLLWFGMRSDPWIS